ncbi:InlB B-repeat-containing protein [Candidatus Ventrimonas sp. KK005]
MKGKRKRARMIRAEALALSAMMMSINVIPVLADTMIPEIGIEASNEDEDKEFATPSNATRVEKEDLNSEEDVKDNLGVQLLNDEAEKITINYFVNGSDKGSEEIEKGSLPDLSDERAGERAGYRFKGWYLEPELINKVAEDDTFNENTSLYGGWERREDKVFITPHSDKYPIERYIVIDKGGTLNGHNAFDVFHRHDRDIPEGWYLEPEFINKADNVVFNEDTDIYVKWDELVYIYYHLNDGTDSVDDEFVVKGDAHNSFFPERYREGYEFGGWYLEPECKNTAPSHKEPLNEDLHLYAKWKMIEGIEVRYYLNDGTNTLYKTRALKENEMKSSVASEHPTRKKHWFGGWYKDKDCREYFYVNSGSHMDDGIVYDEDGDGIIELYAGWTEVVDFVLYMNDGTDTKYEKGEQIKGVWATLNNRIPSREGYKFVGWSTDPEGTDILLEKVYLGEDTELYAQWEQEQEENKEEKVTITYYTDKYTVFKTEEITKGTSLGLKDTPERYRYKFIGWYLDEECKNKVTEDTKFNDNTDLYAGWESLYVTITYYLNDSANKEYGTDIAIKGDKKYIMDPEMFINNNHNFPTRNGYEFTGWYLEPECTTKASGYIDISGDISLYAGWKQIEEVTITYYLDKDTVYKTEEIKKGDTPNLRKPNKEGYTFKGWYLEPECKNIIDSSMSLNKDTSLYAGWKQDGEQSDKIIVTYYLDGYSNEIHKVLETDKGSVDISDEPSMKPARVVYEFTGWYLDKDCKNKVTESDTFENDVNLYAGWRGVNVVFHMNDGTDKIAFTCNLYVEPFLDSEMKIEGEYADKIDKTNGITGGHYMSTLILEDKELELREGYKVEGWYTEPECINLYDKYKPFYEDTDLYAKWKNITEDDEKDDTEKKITITYYLDKETVYKTEEIEKGETPRSDKPFKEGYEFTGWYLDSELTNKVTEDTKLDADTKLYAGWKKKEDNNNNSSDNNGNNNSNGENSSNNGNSNNSGVSSNRGSSSSNTQVNYTYDWYLDSDGKWYLLPKNKWGILSESKKGWYYEEMDKKWYYFDLTDGHMLIGWNFINERWYFFTEVNGGQTYFGDNSKGWKYTPVSEIRPYGSMYCNEITPDGYRVDENGVLK